MEKEPQRKIGVVLSYVSIIISTIVQLVYTPLLIRMLGQSEYGLYSLVSSIIGYLTVLDLGFGNAIVVFTSKYRAEKKYDEEKKLHGMFLVVFFIIGLIAAALGLVLFFNVENIFGNTMSDVELEKMKIMMLILTFNLAVTFPFSIYSSIITAYEKFTFQKIMSIANTILKPILMIPLLFLGFKSITMCLVITLINILVLISNYLFCKRKLNINIKYRGFDKTLFKVILGYSIWIFIGVIVDKINWSVDQFVLGAVSGSIAVSVYSVASQINTLFVNLSTAVSGILLPKVSKMVANKASNKELSEEFIKVGRIQFLIVFLMVSGLVLFGREFITAWAGAEYSDAYYIAMILTIPLIVPLIENLGISILQAKNLHKFRSILYAVIALGNIALSIPLAKNFGGIGSAIGTAISLIIGNIIIINIYYQKKVGLNILKFWSEIFKMLLPMVIPIGAIITLMYLIDLNGFIHLIVFGSIYTIMYFAIAYLLAMNDYERNIVDKVLVKFHLKKVR